MFYKLKIHLLPALFILNSVCTAKFAQAQSDFDLSQRWFNESVYNPGATGNSFSTGIFMHSRLQWLKTDGAPLTSAVAVDTYSEPLQSGIGLLVSVDKIGYLTSWEAKLSYAYYIKIGDKSSLALGLSAYLLNRNKNVTPEMVEVVNDPTLNFSRINDFNSDFDFGVEFKGAVKVGAAVRHLLSSQSTNSLFQPRTLNFWTYASSRFNLSGSLSIEPAVSYMYRSNISRIESGAILYFFKSKSGQTYNDRFWLGGMYRLNKQFAVLAGVNLTSKISLGYSFDYGTNDVATISNYGTHEIFLSWRLNRIFYKEADCPAYRNYKRRYK
jgi:type IX secretion system PorP/SprF family membrane protein